MDEPEEKISLEEFEEWIPASAVMAAGFAIIHSGPEVCQAVLMRLGNGTLRGGCTDAIWYNGNEEIARTKLFIVRPEMWKASLLDHKDQLWKSNQTMFFLDGQGSGSLLGMRKIDNSRVELVDVRFDPRPLDRMYPNSFDLGSRAAITPAFIAAARAKVAGQKQSPPAPRSNAGRLRKEVWDDLTIEIMRQIWVGDLKPGRPSHVLDAMQKWLIGKADAPGDTQLKPVARKIFDVYEKEQEN